MKLFCFLYGHFTDTYRFAVRWTFVVADYSAIFAIASTYGKFNPLYRCS